MRRKRTLSFTILIVTILSFAVLLMLKEVLFDSSLPTSNVKRLAVEKELLPVSENSLLLINSNIMIEGEKTNLRARNIEGTVLWSLKLAGNISSIISCGEDIVVNSENKSILTLSRSGEVLWKYETVIPASDILCSDNGLILIQYKEDKYNSFEIFNTKGTRSCTAVINNAHVISFDGVPGKYYTLSLLDASSDKVLTKIATYNSKSEILWANNYEDILIPKIKYSNKGELIAIAEDSIKKFKPDGKLNKDIDFPNAIARISAGKGLIAAVVKDEDFYDVFVYDYNLKQLGTSAVKTKPEGVFSGSDYFLLYDNDNLTLSNRQGKIIGVYESNIDINSAYINNDSDIYIVSNRKMQKLSL